MSQNQNILKHLRKGSINPLQALKLYGCFRLASRISELKKEGYNIVAKMVTRNNKRFAVYSLEK